MSYSMNEIKNTDIIILGHITMGDGRYVSSKEKGVV